MHSDTRHGGPENSEDAAELRWQLSAVVESSDDAIISKTLDGIIKTWNAGAQRIFGYTAEETVGKPVTMLIPPDRIGEEETILAKLRQGERIHHFETVRVRKDGTHVNISLTSSPITDDEGNVIGASKIARDISDRVLTDQLQSFLAAIIESSEDAIVSKTLAGNITTWNEGAEKMFGYAADEIVGRSILKLIPPKLHVEEATLLGSIRDGKPIQHYQTQRVHRDGSLIDVSLSLSPIKDVQGRIVGASSIARDIGRQIQFEREREILLDSERAARTAAERASLIKDEFLATLSHELRTPLNAILGWSQLLGMGQSTADEIQQGVEAIERNARAQTQLIEDLLDMSRITSGKVRLDVRQVDLATVIDAAVDSVQPAADAKGIFIRKVIASSAGPVSGDSSRLQQVLWNLLSNAIKFTPKGGKVDLFLERVNSHVEITVRDNGAGIDPDFLPNVFDRFRQADSSTTRVHGGLGLGLSIVKHLIELHGGTVRAKSGGKNLGAAFVVTLPLSPVHTDERRSSTHSVQPNQIAPMHLAGLKVLVVDDEQDSRNLIQRVLAHCKADVITAASADEAISLVVERRPDVLISDIGMPGKDGYQFIKQLRSHSVEEGGATPAIALTAFARSEDRTRAMLAGYQVHIAKPIEAQELLAAVGSLAGRLG